MHFGNQIKLLSYIVQIGKKNLFHECKVRCPSKARVTTTRVKLMFFQRRIQFFSARGSKNGFFCTGQ